MDSGTPHPSRRQIDAGARSISTTCSAPQFGQYPCSVRPPNKTPPVQACAAVADAEGGVALGDVRCGDRAGPFPIVRPGYVDCSRIGRVVTMRGEARTFAQTGDDAHDESRADLIEIRVASDAHHLCWDFETAARPAAGEQISLRIGAASAGLDFDTENGPSAQDGNSSMPGQAGSFGNWTSLLVTTGDFDPALRILPSSYSFVASAEWSSSALGTRHADAEDFIRGRYP